MTLLASGEPRGLVCYKYLRQVLDPTVLVQTDKLLSTRFRSIVCLLSCLPCMLLRHGGNTVYVRGFQDLIHDRTKRWIIGKQIPSPSPP